MVVTSDTLSISCLRHLTVWAKALRFRSVRLPRPSVLSFFRSSVLSDRFHLMNGLRNLDKPYSQYSVVHTDDLIGFWRSTVKVQGHSRRR